MSQYVNIKVFCTVYMLEQQKKAIIWIASHDSLQQFVNEHLNLRKGNWNYTGGVAKWHKSEQLGILYGACAKFSAQSLERGSEIQYSGV